MTHEEAIYILNPKTTAEALRNINNQFDAMDVVDEARVMACEALEKYEALKKEHETLHNEHCQMCGAYKREYTGICDGCRWKR